MIIQSREIVNGVNLATPKCPIPPRYAKIANELDKPLIVACVWWGNLYGKEYVEKLYDAVSRNLTIPFTFHCITDEQNLSTPFPGRNIFKILTPTTEKGWWQKVNLFKEGMFPAESRVFYLDLDVVITGSLDELVKSEGDIVMIENFGPNKKHAAHNSSAMLWTPSDLTQVIFNAFSHKVTEELHGDQCWIWRVMDSFIRDFSPEFADSYKYRQREEWRRNKTGLAPIIVFHGNPKPHQCNDDWIQKHW